MSSRIICFLKLAATVAILLSGPAQAATITVNTDTSGSGCTLMDAIDSANADSGLGGCALTTTGIYGDDVIVIPTSQIIQTLFAVNNTTDGANGLPVITSNIVIDGNNALIHRSSAAGTPEFRLFYVAATGNLTLNNIRLEGGVANNGAPTQPLLDEGAAILNNGGAVQINHCTIRQNTNGDMARGVVTNNYGTLGVSDSILSDNQGRGLESYGYTTVISNTIISRNSGGAAINGGTGRIYNSEITENQWNGVVTGNNANLTIRDSTISNNLEEGLSNYLVSAASNPTITLINTTVSNNSKQGIIHKGGTLNLVNTIVSGNGSTLAGTTESNGREILVAPAASGATPTLGTQRNNLIGHNGLTNAVAMSGYTPSASDITATSDGTKPTPLNQIILPLANNGGPTRTHALPPGSPALDAAVTTYFTGGLLFSGEGCAYTSFFPSFSTIYRPDQRGIKRPQNGKCDIGAYEEEETTFFVIPTSGGKTVIFGL